MGILFSDFTAGPNGVSWLSENLRISFTGRPILCLIMAKMSAYKLQ